jgi:hypothetical protein
MSQSENVKKPWYKKWWVLALFAAIVFNAVWNSGGKEESPTHNKQQDTTLSVAVSDNSSSNGDLESESKSTENSAEANDENIRNKQETDGNSVKVAAKSNNHFGLYTFNNLTYGNFLILEKNGVVKAGLFDQKGYCNSRCEGVYTFEGNVLTISDVYNPNWDRASELNGEWSIEGTKIKQLSSASGLYWFKKNKYQDLGSKIIL